MAKRLKSWLWGYCCDLKKQDATEKITIYPVSYTHLTLPTT